jgi:hypothetical protein
MLVSGTSEQEDARLPSQNKLRDMFSRFWDMPNVLAPAGPRYWDCELTIEEPFWRKPARSFGTL